MMDARSKTWMVQTDTQVVGPYTLDRLRQLALQGHIHRSTLLRAEGQNQWIVAGQVPAIFDRDPHSQSARPAAAREANSRPQSTQPQKSQPVFAGPPPVDQAPSQAPSQLQMVIIGGAAGLGVLVLSLILLAVARWTATPRASTEVAVKSPSAPDAVHSRIDSPPPASPSVPRSASAQGQTPAIEAVASSDNATSETDFESSLPAKPRMETPSKTPAEPSESVPAEFRSTEELVRQTQHAVAIVAASNSSGSGFLVAPKLLATNYHVIADAELRSLQVFFPDNDDHRGPFTASLISELPDRDLALLRVDVDAEPLKISPNHTFRRGQDVVVIGSPGLGRGDGILPNAVTRGILSSTITNAGGQLYQLSLAVNPGNSGGPVFGLTGEVIGVVVSKSSQQEAIGFAIPVSDLNAFVKESTSKGSDDIATEAALHHARITVRSLVQTNMDRAKAYEKLIEIAQENPNRSTSSELSQIADHLLANNAPQLLHSYQSELRSLSQEASLPFEVRRAMGRLLELQRSIESLYDSPPQSMQTFLDSIESRTGQLIIEVGRMKPIFEIGMPELAQKD